jgi:subtilisin-like proprotein convertase family protein
MLPDPETQSITAFKDFSRMNFINKAFKSVALATTLLGVGCLRAGIFSATETLPGGSPIGDPPIPGLARTLLVSTPVTAITDLSITLDISSADADTAWNGDLYAQLTSPMGTLSVLLNQSGRTAANPAGYGNTGFVITVLDSASSDIHSYRDVGYSLNGSGQVTGTWQSDGRVDPLGSLRDRQISQLVGENPNGTWTLLVSDLANGNRAKLNSWSINGVGTTVPEPQLAVLAVGTALAGLTLWRRVAR